ncbi:MAG: hypothetical protein R3B70_34130 [Polyangiaceae bacterium]
MRNGTLLLGGLLLAATSLGCDPPPPAKAPNPTRTLDERRAIEVIRNAVAAEGARPAAAREETLTNSGKPIRIDVSVDGRKFGLVYVSDEDRSALGAVLPEPNKKDESLKILRAGADGTIVLVLLYQSNYRYDDLVGSGHEQTVITAENELARDVRYAVVGANTRKWE